MLRIVFWQRKVRLSSNLGQFNFASASLYDVPGRIIRKTLFWTISIFIDRYFDRLLCQITQQYSRILMQMIKEMRIKRYRSNQKRCKAEANGHKKAAKINEEMEKESQGHIHCKLKICV